MQIFIEITFLKRCTPIASDVSYCAGYSSGVQRNFHNIMKIQQLLRLYKQAGTFQKRCSTSHLNCWFIVLWCLYSCLYLCQCKPLFVVFLLGGLNFSPIFIFDPFSWVFSLYAVFLFNPRVSFLTTLSAFLAVLTTN